MADQGKLYTGFDMDFAKAMTALCRKADIIDPNITEACFMTGMPYRETYDERYVRKLMDRLTDLGAKTIVITGVTLEPGKTGVVGMDTATGKTYHYFHPHFKGQFHGTGDIFSSSVVGALMNGRSLDEALRISANFTYECIRQTAMDPNASWYGVAFEKALPYLFGFAAGTMLYVIADGLLDRDEEKPTAVPLCFIAGFSLMMTLDVALG